MGGKRTRPLSYAQITEQAELTMRMLMKQAHIPTNHEMTKNQAVSNALGAFVLWQDLTKGFADTEDDKGYLLSLLTTEPSK